MKTGKVTQEFFLWMERFFGWDIGNFILIPVWMQKEVPCKFDPKAKSICNGYYDSAAISLTDIDEWEIRQDDEYFYLEFWERGYSKEEYIPTYSFLIKKTITLPYIEQLDMERYGL